MKLAVLGAGAWGTALAISLASRHHVTLWTRSSEHASALSLSRENARYLPGCPIPEAVVVSTDWRQVEGSESLICAVPMAALRQVLAQIRASTRVPWVLACKGFEPHSAMLPHEVARSARAEQPVCVLSGPSFAHEVAIGLPAAVVLAADEADLAERLVQELHSPRLRMYSNTDLVGVEVAGAAKNVMAIAAGICDGLGLGLNARAAMVTRGLAEVTRLGLKLGGRTETFMGLAGLGDLILTCTGDRSRNRTVGLKLAAGISLERILAELGHVAEGVGTAFEVDQLAARLGVDMPITRAVCVVLSGRVPPKTAVAALLERDPKAEF